MAADVAAEKGADNTLSTDDDDSRLDNGVDTSRELATVAD